MLGARDRCCVGFWLGLCPDNRVSGGKVLKAKTRKVVSRVAAALRLAAQSLRNREHQLGEDGRRMKARLGKAEGLTATAHQLARIRRERAAPAGL